MGSNQNDVILSPMEMDAIGEVMNICMGSAATAVASILDKPVSITTPKVSLEKISQIDYRPLEPALIVKITYIEGVEGSNVMVLRQRDMQMIINQMMGVDGPPSDDFVFDELSMSAACEVMNQMMGAAATALSEFLGKPINISTPTAMVMDNQNTFLSAVDLDAQADIVSILFDLKIQDVMETEFVSVFSCDFAKAIVGQFASEEVAPAPAQAPAKAPAPQQAAPMPQQAAPVQQAAPPPQQYPQATPPQQMPPMQQDPYGQMPQQPYGQMPPQPYGQQGAYPYPPQGYPGYPPQGYPMYPPQGYPMQGYPQPAPMEEKKAAVASVKVQNVQFPEFQPASGDGNALFGGNMDLIMNVPLEVEIVIGTAKRKIKDILEFSQGTVVELDKQAGAPVDIVVNGQLIAHGDVVVIDDNFGVRVTEIIGTKELLNSLDKQAKETQRGR